MAVAEKVADLESTVPEDTVGRGKIVASPEVTMLVLTHIGLGDAEWVDIEGWRPDIGSAIEASFDVVPVDVE